MRPRGMKKGEKDYLQLAGEMVRRARERKGWSQDQFGARLGEFLGKPAILRQQIGRYESDGTKAPADAISAYYLLAIKDMTGLSLDSLFDEVDTEGLRAHVAELQKQVDLLRRALN